MKSLAAVVLALFASVAFANGKAVSIQGEQYAEAVTETASSDEIIGSWTDGRIDGLLTIVLRDGRFILKDSYPDGSSGERELATSETSRGTRYETDNRIGEYFVASPDGRLEFWSNSGNYYTAEPAL